MNAVFSILALMLSTASAFQLVGGPAGVAMVTRPAARIFMEEATPEPATAEPAAAVAEPPAPAPAPEAPEGAMGAINNNVVYGAFAAVVVYALVSGDGTTRI